MNDDAIARGLNSIASALACGAQDDVSAAIHDLAYAIQRLGNADASTNLGGLEALGMQIEKAGHDIALALDGLAASISEHGKEKEARS